MSVIYRTTSFILDKIKDEPDLARVRYRVRWNKQTVAFNCGTTVEISKWSADTQRCIRNSTHGKKRIPAKEINAILDNLEDKVSEAFDYFGGEEDVEPTADEFRQKVNVLLGRKAEPREANKFGLAVDQYLIYGLRERGWADQSADTIKRTIRSVLAFKPDITFEDTSDPDLYKNYVQFLMSRYNNSTVNVYASQFKTFLKWCKKNKYVDNIDCTETAPYIKKNKNNAIVFLTREELEKFRGYDFDLKRYNIIRDMYCFCAFTSLRHSDLIRLRVGYVNNGILHITLLKTGKDVDIELNKTTKALFKKYSEGKGNEDLLFPTISCDSADKMLAIMFKKIGFDSPVNVTKTYNNKKTTEIVPKYKKLTFHTSRKTFICQALSMGIPPIVVMKWTGHSNFESMKPYIDIATETKKQAMSMFDF